MKPYPNEELDRMSKREIIRLYKRTVEQFNDAVPVRHGKWIRHYCEDGNPDGWQCGQCGEWYYFGKTKPNFCPNCGARMDERKSE